MPELAYSFLKMTNNFENEGGFALHIPNQTAIMDPIFAEIPDPIRNSTSLTNTSLPPVPQLTNNISITNGMLPDSVVPCVDNTDYLTTIARIYPIGVEAADE